jgi:dihydrofolate reductase
MPRLIFSTIASLDGYTVDDSGGFAWAAPDDEVHSHVNDQQRPVATYLYGRRMYETMRVWQDLPAPAGSPAGEYADIWRAASKVVFSSTLEQPTTPKTEVRRRFDVATVRGILDAAPGDVSIGGPTLAAEAFRAGLVDEVQLYLVPVSVGGGTPALPRGTFVRFGLREERRFAAGTVFLRYDVSASEG